MKFGVLGPLTVWDDVGEIRPIVQPKSKLLLAALLLEPNGIVSVDAVKEIMWGEKQPPTATASLHNHVGRLRRALGGGDGDRIRSTRYGFEIQVGDGELDGESFARHLSRAQRALGEGDWRTANEEAASALRLWRGSPLADLPSFDGHLRVVSYQEQRLEALECRFDALLRLGRLDGLATELGALAKEHPLREAFHRQLMLVLDRTGRKAEAILVFHGLRETLVEELGVEPGPAIQEVNQEILSAEARREQPNPDAEPPARLPTVPRPAQLPKPPTEFVGRTDEIAAIRAALTGQRAHTAVAIVSGMAGVGKTGLALRAADGLRAAFPDGQLFLNLHGATPGVPPLDPSQALTALLCGLGLEARSVPVDVQAAFARLRSVLAGTRTLLVLDDAASASQVRPLLPAAPGCAVLITSRLPLATLDPTLRTPLALLSSAESAQLLARASGRTWTTADDDVMGELVALCGRLPLALRVTAARLATRRVLTARNLVERLAAQEQRLDHFELDDLSVRRSLGVAHATLRASDAPRDQNAGLALVRIGALDLPTYPTSLVARLMGTSERDAEEALDRLVEVALLEDVSDGRYSAHALVRDFARELARRDDEQEECAAAVMRALSWYIAKAGRAATALRHLIQSTVVRAWEDRGAAPFLSPADALAWADQERENLLFLAAQGGDGPMDRAQALELMEALFPYLHDRGRIEEMKSLVHGAISLSRSHGDVTAHCQALLNLGRTYYTAGHLHDALLLIDEAIVVGEGHHEPAAMVTMLGNRAALLKELGRAAEARTALDQCLALRTEQLSPMREAILLGHQGYVAELHDLRLAVRYHRQSLEVAERIDYPLIQQVALCNLAHAHLALHEADIALVHFARGLAVVSDTSHWNAEREIRLGEARALRALGRLDAAHGACETLRTLAEERGDLYATGLADHEHGHILRALGDEPSAQERWKSALWTLARTDAPVLEELRLLVKSNSLPAPRPPASAPEPVCSA
ncbi:BTAD domain-containing putative transcriptional regulator [Streptomyces sp. NBC_00094]|uniref:AfsR/SARP family transcriptional regulator n=1 Tax=Streptomyces sp. NBC_00094 TaxID=2903620 RepID=UPI0022568165|nr:BTAD domain-containing putative transcriptional regulator [Streptomyces sp. NBC_00094]MCX5395093.1 NB-ARC domain-containing protein [Streptomyces sp. NBC_00094]